VKIYPLGTLSHRDLPPRGLRKFIPKGSVVKTFIKNSKIALELGGWGKREMNNVK
jgi:hypothetical protein